VNINGIVRLYGCCGTLRIYYVKKITEINMDSCRKTLFFILLFSISIVCNSQSKAKIRFIYSYAGEDSSGIRLVSKSYLNDQLLEDSSIVYNEDGKIHYREYFSYDERGNLIENLAIGWPSVSDISKDVYKYNEYNKIIECKESVKENGLWLLKDSCVREYDSNQNCIKSFSTENPYYNFINTYIYDSNHRISQKITYRNKNKQVIESNYKYYDNSYTIISQSKIDSTELNEIEVYYLDSNKRVIEKITNYGNVRGTVNIYSSDYLIKTITYNKDGERLSTSIYKYE
jgi:hypothetical protein